MANNPPISAFIICLNEADRIHRALESLQGWVDEIIIVDSGSDDGTRQRAEKYPVKFFHRDFDGYGMQKRYAESLCRNDWLLNLDADEAITPGLRDEILSYFDSMDDSQRCDIAAWKIAIRDVYPHEIRPARWAFGYWQIRLYNRRHCRFSPSPIHDSVQPSKNAPIGRMNGIIEHRSVRSISDQIAKLNRISNMQATEMTEKGRRVSRPRLLLEFALCFLKAYIIRRYLFQGYWGFIQSMTYAYSRFVRLAKLYEKELNDKSEKMKQKK